MKLDILSLYNTFLVFIVVTLAGIIYRFLSAKFKDQLSELSTIRVRLSDIEKNVTDHAHELNQQFSNILGNVLEVQSRVGGVENKLNVITGKLNDVNVKLLAILKAHHERLVKLEESYKVAIGSEKLMVKKKKE